MTETRDTQDFRKDWLIRAGTAIVGILLVLMLALIPALPRVTPEYWWHLAYGDYFVRNSTLIPDHQAFSWPPVNESAIYANWIPELSFWAFTALFGPDGAHIILYAIAVTLVASVLFVSRTQGLMLHPLSLLIALVGLYGATDVLAMDMSSFGLLFWTLILSCWVLARKSAVRPLAALYAIPVLSFLWANSHESIIFGAAALFLLLLAEELNLFFGRDFFGRNRKHVRIALVAAILAILVTPYTIRYPWSLLTEMSQYFLVPSMLIMESITGLFAVTCAAWLGLFWWSRHSRPLDYALALPPLLLLPLGIMVPGLQFLWIIFAAFSALQMLDQNVSWLHPTLRFERFKIAFLCAAASVLVCGNIGARKLFRPDGAGWLDFPHAEAEYINKHFPSSRIGTDDRNGAYFMWRYGPTRRVMIDGRRLVHKNWSKRYVEFKYSKEIKKFLEDYSADVWCISFPHVFLLPWFTESGDWKLAFYDLGCAVYVRKDSTVPTDSPRGPGVLNFKTFEQGKWLFNFATVIKDRQLREEVLAAIKKLPLDKHQEDSVKAMERFLLVS